VEERGLTNMNFDNLFKKAKAAGIEDIQVTYSAGTEFDLEVFKGEIEKYQIADTAGLSVKGIYKGKMGTVRTEVINEESFDFIIDSIVQSANAIDSKDEVFIYEGDDEYPEVEGLFDPSLAEVPAARKIEDTKKLEKLVMASDKRVRMAQSYYGEGTTNMVMENSKGLKLSKKVNSGYFYTQVIASDGEDQRTGFEFVFSNDYNDFDLEALATKAANKATAMLGAKPCESGNYEILLTNQASASLLNPYLSMFSAEAVQRGVSLLKDKVGEQIGSELITIVDDPFKAKSPRSGAFDSEGVATQRKEMVKAGKLTGYLHNLKTAKKAGTKSTGNASGSGVGPTNFYIESGDMKYDEAVASMKKGLIITDLAGTHAGANAISGAFSLQASGYLVEDGKVVRPVALITVAGNYLDLLKDVVGVCDDLHFNYAYIGSPSLKIKNLVVAGK
jgi:PmbA protein